MTTTQQAHEYATAQAAEYARQRHDEVMRGVAPYDPAASAAKRQEYLRCYGDATIAMGWCDMRHIAYAGPAEAIATYAAQATRRLA